MKQQGTDRRKTVVYHASFALAILALLAGAGLLVTTTGRVGGRDVVMPLSLAALGTLYSYFAYVGRRTAKSRFIGMFASGVGLARFVGNVVGVSIGVYWPIFAILAGLCMLPAGFARYGKGRPGFIVPAFAFMVLGAFFCIFSFGFSSVRFTSFMSLWWPALIIAAGLFLLLAWFFLRLVRRDAPGGGDAGESGESGESGETGGRP